MKTYTLFILIVSLVLLGPSRTPAQGLNTFTATFNSPDSFNGSIPQVSPCCKWNWAITPSQVNFSIPEGIVSVTNISVSGNVKDQDQPIGGRWLGRFGRAAASAEIFTNVSSSPITLGTFAITGPDAPSFTRTVSDCYQRTMAPNDSCTINLAFSPGHTRHRCPCRNNERG
jgi:hypothetical protein